MKLEGQPNFFEIWNSDNSHTEVLQRSDEKIKNLRLKFETNTKLFEDKGVDEKRGDDANSKVEFEGKSIYIRDEDSQPHYRG